jgi:hypothetical protein
MPMQPVGFMPLQLNLPDTAASTLDVVIEIRRGAAMVTIRWRTACYGVVLARQALFDPALVSRTAAYAALSMFSTSTGVR